MKRTITNPDGRVLISNHPLEQEAFLTGKKLWSAECCWYMGFETMCPTHKKNNTHIQAEEAWCCNCQNIYFVFSFSMNCPHCEDMVTKPEIAMKPYQKRGVKGETEIYYQYQAGGRSFGRSFGLGFCPQSGIWREYLGSINVYSKLPLIGEWQKGEIVKPKNFNEKSIKELIWIGAKKFPELF